MLFLEFRIPCCSGIDTYRSATTFFLTIPVIHFTRWSLKTPLCSLYKRSGVNKHPMSTRLCVTQNGRTGKVLGPRTQLIHPCTHASYRELPPGRAKVSC